jgi:hypothetical protein
MVEWHPDQGEQQAERVTVEAVDVIAPLQDSQTSIMTLRTAHEGRYRQGGEARNQLPVSARSAGVGAAKTQALDERSLRPS